MSTQNRRQHPRYCLSLDVNLISPGKEAIACSVRDFCLGGLYVQIDANVAKARQAAVDGLRKHAELTVEYVAPNNKRLSIPSRIAHIAGLGIGIQFINANDLTLDGLLQTASQQREENQHILGLADGQPITDKEDLLPLTKDMLERFSISLFHDYYETTVDTLFERAGKASNNAEQGLMFEAMDAVNKSRDGFFHQVRTSVAGQFDAFVDNRPFAVDEEKNSKARSGLSLVEIDEFQNWLALTGVVSKLESRYDEKLYAIEKRLEYIVGRPVAQAQNPLAPAAICRSFQDLIAKFDVADAPKQVIQRAFQQTIDRKLGVFFDALNELFIAYDILPNIDREMRFVKAEAPAADNDLGADDAEDQDEPSSSENTQPEQPKPNANAGHGHRGEGGQAPASMSRMGAAATGTTATSRAGSDTPARPRASLSGAMNLMDMQDELQHGMAMSSMSAGQAVQANTHSTASSHSSANPAPDRQAQSQSRDVNFNNSEILSALDNVSYELQTMRERRAHGQSLLEQLRESLSHLPSNGQSRTISPQASRSIEVVDNLMGSIQSDHISTEWSKSNLGQLEVPLAKSALVDTALLMDADSPASELINRLDQVGTFFCNDASQEVTPLQSEVAQIVNEVTNSAGEDKEAYTSALNQLDTLYEKARRDYEVHVSSVRKESEDKYQLEQKRKELLKILDDVIGNHKIPVIVTKILDAGWKNLLLRTYVREGQQGKSFRAYFEIVNQLLATLSNDDQWIRDKRWSEGTILELVRRGLAHVPVSADKLDSLMGMLEPQIQMAKADPNSIEVALIPSLTGKMEKKQREQLKKRIAGRFNEEVWKTAQDSVISMEEGDVLSIADEFGRKQQHKLIWSSKDRDHYVFVNGEGAKSYDFELNDLTDKILENDAAIVEGLDVPLMDRASYSMLMSIHNKLLHSSNFDALTGLLNRRSYELSLNRVLEKSRIDKTKSLICYFDLDRFNVINNSCGHDLGDKLLREIADILRSSFHESNVISRAGDDEFGIIMEDTSRTEGLQQIKSLQERFHGHHFKCESQDFTVSASFALVEISPLTESVRSLLSATDSACFTAKESGRDRIEIYHQDNEAIVRRDNMLSWVGKISRLFEGDHIQLRAQRIYPLSEMGDAHSHYEILLSVRDDEGAPVSNDQFIQAAEIYNRIIDVDRWVVDHAVGWLESLLAAGKKLPAISINLSGRSVNNKSFMDDMVELLKKTSVSTRYICFEITETAAIGNLGQATHFIKKIKALGCQFSLDDFGTGLSSYSYLKALPVDYLKIDGSFVKNIMTDLNDQAVVKSINEIGHAMGKRTVAEYVENNEILELLRSMGVDYAQGYTIEKPTLLSELKIA